MGTPDEARDDLMMSDVRSVMEVVITRLRSFIENEARS